MQCHPLRPRWHLHAPPSREREEDVGMIKCFLGSRRGPCASLLWFLYFIYMAKCCPVCGFHVISTVFTLFLTPSWEYFMEKRDMSNMFPVDVQLRSSELCRGRRCWFACFQIEHQALNESVTSSVRLSEIREETQRERPVFTGINITGQEDKRTSEARKMLLTP